MKLTEQWKTIKEFPNYMISSNGRVWSKTRIVTGSKGKYLKKGKILKQRTNTRGYSQLTLTNGPIQKSRSVHRLVAIAFLEKKKCKNDVNHINAIKTDNRVSNLEWVTYKENMVHARKLGLFKKTKFYGGNSTNSKFKNHQIIEIRKKYESDGISQEEWAEMYGTSQSNIQKIVNYISYKTVRVSDLEVIESE